jgi:hypothetical protein
MQQPPHDTQLYDILQVNPNLSTQAQIAKSHRNLSRKYHPDKATCDSQDDQKRRLQKFNVPMMIFLAMTQLVYVITSMEFWIPT